MKIGDLVRDRFGNMGVVLETHEFGNGIGVYVQFAPGSGHEEEHAWMLDTFLETLNEDR